MKTVRMARMQILRTPEKLMRKKKKKKKKRTFKKQP